ncbi:MAG: DUF1275 domain-containing protein [Clostridia bacterium]|nr:DUF1275 domain-containing protein [Clostridia bacterium]
MTQQKDLSKGRGNSSERLHLAMMLSILGGIMDGYSYSVRGGVFATGQTGNLIIFAYRFVHGQYDRAFRAFVPILGFWMGIFAAQFILNHVANIHGEDAERNRKLKNRVMLLEAFILFCIGFVPDTVLDIIPNSITSLLAAMQFSAFRKFEDEMAYASVFCTGNMRSCAELYYKGIFQKNHSALKRAFKYTAILLSFLTGAVLAMIIGESIGEKTIWIGSCVALACAFLFLKE